MVWVLDLDLGLGLGLGVDLTLGLGLLVTHHVQGKGAGRGCLGLIGTNRGTPMCASKSTSTPHSLV